MAWFGCMVCHQSSPDVFDWPKREDGKWVCPKCAHIADDWFKQEQRYNDLNRHFDRLKQGLHRILEAVDDQIQDGRDVIAVRATDLKAALAALAWDGNAEQYLFATHLRIGVVAAAVTLFMKWGHEKSMTERLRRLEDACRSHHQSNYPDSDHPLDQSTDDLVAKLRSE